MMKIMPRVSPTPVAYGMPNSALTGCRNALMMVRLDIPSEDQYGGATWVPLGIIEDTPYTVTEITLTVAQIIDLAKSAGLSIEEATLPSEEEEYETEVSIRAYWPAQPFPVEGADPSEPIERYTHIALFPEVPEEGVYPLGAAQSPDANS